MKTLSVTVSLLLLFIATFVMAFPEHKADVVKPWSEHVISEQQPDPELVAGKKIYLHHCTSCHGRKGKLGLKGAANLQKSTLDDEIVKYIIQNGKGNMLPYKDAFNDEELRKLIKFVKTMRTSSK